MRAIATSSWYEFGGVTNEGTQLSVRVFTFCCAYVEVSVNLHAVCLVAAGLLCDTRDGFSWHVVVALSAVWIIVCTREVCSLAEPLCVALRSTRSTWVRK